MNWRCRLTGHRWTEPYPAWLILADSLSWAEHKELQMAVDCTRRGCYAQRALGPAYGIPYQRAKHAPTLNQADKHTTKGEA